MWLVFVVDVVRMSVRIGLDNLKHKNIIGTISNITVWPFKTGKRTHLDNFIFWRLVQSGVFVCYTTIDSSSLCRYRLYMWTRVYVMFFLSIFNFVINEPYLFQISFFFDFDNPTWINTVYIRKKNKLANILKITMNKNKIWMI